MNQSGFVIEITGTQNPLIIYGNKETTGLSTREKCADLFERETDKQMTADYSSLDQNRNDLLMMPCEITKAHFHMHHRLKYCLK